MEPKNIPGSQGKDGSTPKDKDSINATTKTEENIFPKPKPRTLDSQISSRSKTQTGGTSTVQDTPVKTEDPGSPVSKDDEKKGATMKSEPPINSLPSAQAEAHPQAKSPSLHPNDTSSTPAIQIVPVPTATTSPSSTLATAKDTTSSQTTPTSPSLTTNSASSLNSVSLSPSDPFSAASVNNDQGSTPHSTTPVTSANIHSTEALPPPLVPYSSLGESQSPALSTSSAVTVAVDPKTVATSITSTITTTVTTTSAAPGSVTILTVSAKTQPSISSTNQAPGIHRIPQPPTEAAPSGAEIIKPAINPPHTSLSSDTPSKGNPTIPIKVQTAKNFNYNYFTYKDTEAKSATDALPKPKGPMQPLVVPLSKNTQQETGHASNTLAPITYSNLQSTTHHIDQQVSPTEVHHSPKIDAVSLASDRSGASVTSPNVNTKTATMDDSKVRTDKNDNPRIIPEEISSLTHIIPTLLYTPFGFLLGRRRKRKKQDLRRIFEKPEKPAYESPNITVHEWEDPNLVGQTVENDVYTKLLKINRYKQEIQKRKKKNKKTLIEVHMEVLEEYKTDDWELHKGDFLEICVRGFINEENETYQKFPNSKLTINNINEKTIEYIKKQDILWNNWIENHRNILEQWKKEEWFHILKNKWRNEEQKYKEKNDKLQENILNEQETHSIVSQKDIWKQWISKQATLIKMFNQEGWFKELVYAQDKEKDNYHINEYNNVTVTTETQLKNEKSNHEHCRSENIIQKLMVQIHMMVLEECIKDEIIKQKELCIDNFIEDIHNNNNYDEKRNIPLCDTDNSKVPKCEEMHTSRNK
ncbi:STP1 protein [Plasmodium ovale wallikeri]|uniref:STP1 protein n=1 Tax=Plasmodium ovale wallikeri TaxID=864142 RepID=A0A1A9AK26_PLAOA|nr:STP1 protein [Plasmodium ovale wallikeri]